MPLIRLKMTEQEKKLKCAKLVKAYIINVGEFDKEQQSHMAKVSEFTGLSPKDIQDGITELIKMGIVEEI